MFGSTDVGMLIRRGGVIKNVEGKTLKDVYDYVASRAKLPEGVTAEVFSGELYMREQVLSTAVGNSIAIPHPRRTLLKDPDDERIIVCYLKQPMDMHAPDLFSVHTMFIVLSSSAQSHLGVLSSLAKIFRNKEFVRFLSMQPDAEQLVRKIGMLDLS